MHASTGSCLCRVLDGGLGLVARRLLDDWRRTAKQEVADKGTDRHREHHPTVVRHEDKPEQRLEAKTTGN